MNYLRQPPARPGYPQSPCIEICTLNEANVCQGCMRTVQEIVDWSRMSAAQQWAVINELPGRRDGPTSGR
jgi:uncharacterized protein